MIDFGVVGGQPELTRNVLHRANFGNNMAAFKQSPEEHRKLLDKYKKPGMTAMQLRAAHMNGKKAEKKFIRYWDDDTKPRRPLTPSSSFITSLKYDPVNKVAWVGMNGNEYEYPMDQYEVGRWVTSGSLGKFYNQRVKLKK